jgi:hypothetical protein
MNRVHDAHSDMHRVRNHLDTNISTGFGVRHFEHLGNTAALHDYLKHYGKGHEHAIRKELKEFVAYMHMYETTKNPVYASQADFELHDIWEEIEHLPESKEKEALIAYVNSLKAAFETLKSGGKVTAVPFEASTMKHNPY